MRVFLCLLIAASLCSSQDVNRRGMLKFAAAATTYLIDEDCEGTGTPSGWTNTGSPNWDQTTVALDGSQSLAMTAAATAPRAHYDTGSAYSEVWVRFKFRTTSVSASTRVMSLRVQSGDAEPAFLITNGTGDALRATMGAVTATTVSTMSSNVTYNVWVYYKAGSGSDAVMSVAFSTDATEPTSGDNFASMSNGTATASINRFQWRNQATSGGNINYFDRMTVNNSAIGSF